ncbi:cobyric acid synthase [Opitutus sp. ER46]|uniref:cobyric acid synthase n=1 Tax=Opitutus sp. ER46 TaxID=2161864 RepID=UPI000D326CAE|nr:cobyric acid synthase [Opitutus sp. ER46]PTX92386.1 cobyric acid synthase [Opitutus sp. ER46]
MKALSVLGTSSSAGKSWMATALCAWLRRQGVRVAPCKTQNMSNNAWVTLEGGEIGRAQAVQAEACGLRPTAEMNPILLKPTGPHGSQLVLCGQARGHLEAQAYYREIDRLWRVVAGVLDGWRDRCDVLVLEGAGSPVELNLMSRDLANLRPVRHLDGRWVLVGDIDRGGIYAQLAGTWALMPQEDRARGLGAIINRFRGDIALFPDPQAWLTPHAPGFNVLGTVPLRPDLQPEEEDGLKPGDEVRGTGAPIAWLRFPHAANLSDCQPWWDDTGVSTRWVANVGELAAARAIVLPGTKNTVADLNWLHATGLGAAIVAAAERGVPVIGICGGYQILGRRVSDPQGVAGDAGDVPGLGLLPTTTTFESQKIVRQVTATCGGESWMAYEIHMGRTQIDAGAMPLQEVCDADGSVRPEGVRCGKVWGTYLHGWFEAAAVRRRVAELAGITSYAAHPVPWAQRRLAIYDAMAEHIERHLNLEPVRRYLGL